MLKDLFRFFRFDECKQCLFLRNSDSLTKEERTPVLGGNPGFGWSATRTGGTVCRKSLLRQKHECLFDALRFYVSVEKAVDCRPRESFRMTYK